MREKVGSENATRSMAAVQLKRCGSCQSKGEVQQRIDRSPYQMAQAGKPVNSFCDNLPRKPLQKKNTTGMPDQVKETMESSFKTDFSNVRIHESSSKAPEVGALAYTQGTDIHFAPGQFSPDTAGGRQLLGHELTHVVQQGQDRVRPTTEISGMPVNDNPALEKEADDMGNKVGR